MKNHFLFIITFLFVFGFSSFKTLDTTCPEPTNIRVTAKSQGSISFDWDDCNCSQGGFKVKFINNTTGYVSPEYHAGNPNFNFSGLSAGNYSFFFKAACAGETSGFIGVEDVMNL